HHSRNLFWDCLHCDDFTRPQPYVRNAGRSALVVEVYHLIFHAVLVWDRDRVLLQRDRLRGTVGWSCGSQFSAGLSAASMDRDPEFAIHLRGTGPSRAGAVSVHAGKLSHLASGFAWRDFVFGRLDYRDEAFSTLCGAI